MRNEPWVRRPLAARQVVRRLRQLVELAPPSAIRAGERDRHVREPHLSSTEKSSRPEGYVLAVVLVVVVVAVGVPAGGIVDGGLVEG
jgi:hypothetical protein